MITSEHSFTFSIRIDDEGGLFAPSTIAVPNVTIPAGPQSSGGTCAFAQGPYAPTQGTPPVGTFRVGSRVYITELPSPGTSPSISSPTGTVIACSPGDPRCGGLVMTSPNGFNEIVFTNTVSAPVTTGFAISGRVLTPDGAGLRNAQVTITFPDGTTRTVPTSSMGYYTIEGLQSQQYLITVASRRYRFDAQRVDLINSLSALDFVGLE